MNCSSPPSPSSPQDFSKLSLLNAIRVGDDSFLEGLISSGVCGVDVVDFSLEMPSTKFAKFSSPIQVASRFGKSEILKRLIELVEIVDHKRLVPLLSIACGPQAWTPLMWAAFNSNVECTRLLIDHGSPLDEIDSLGRSSLHLAVASKSLECVRLLAESGCPLDTRDKRGVSVFDFAALLGDSDVIFVLLQLGCSSHSLATTTTSPGDARLPPSSPLPPAYFLSLYHLSSSSFDAFISSGIDPCVVDPLTGAGAMHWLVAGACKCQNPLPEFVPLMVRLIQLGVSMNSPDFNHCSPLHWALREGASVELLDIICQMGASLELRDEHGNTAIHEACIEGSIPAIEYLLSAGGDLEVLNIDGKTPMQHAIALHHEAAFNFCVNWKMNREKEGGVRSSLGNESLMKTNAAAAGGRGRGGLHDSNSNHNHYYNHRVGGGGGGRNSLESMLNQENRVKKSVPFMQLVQAENRAYWEAQRGEDNTNASGSSASNNPSQTPRHRRVSFVSSPRDVVDLHLDIDDDIDDIDDDDDLNMREIIVMDPSPSPSPSSHPPRASSTSPTTTNTTSTKTSSSHSSSSSSTIVAAGDQKRCGSVKLALVLANSNYLSSSTLSVLPQAVVSTAARSLTSQLRKLGFSAKMVSDCDMSSMRSEIDDFCSRVENLSAKLGNDVDFEMDLIALVHFVGHGGHDRSKRNFLLPIDYNRASSPPSPPGIELSSIVGRLVRNCNLTIVGLDCSTPFSSSVWNSATAPASSLSPGLVAPNAPSWEVNGIKRHSSWISMSASPGRTVPGTAMDQWFRFSENFISVLEEIAERNIEEEEEDDEEIKEHTKRKRELSESELNTVMNRVRDKCFRMSDRGQLPYITHCFREKFYF